MGGGTIKRTYRTIWVSDIHLGSRDCKADFLLDFFRYNESDTLYLVGDIIDGWRLKRQWHWPQAHSTVIQKILRKSRKGTKVIYVPGNHDSFLRDYIGLQLGEIELREQDVHETADGKRFLILHGDEFDGVIRHARWLYYIGDKAYDFALRLNRWINFFRSRRGKPYWSFSATLKKKVKRAVQLVNDFEKYLVETARRHDADGVICGHIHHAEMKEMEGILYCNDGDWVESCTALVEHHDGRLELIDWTEEYNKRHFAPAQASVTAKPNGAAHEDIHAG